MFLKFAIVAYLINFSASNQADNKVQFEFKEFDFKETSKNVSIDLIRLKIDNFFRTMTKLFLFSTFFFVVAAPFALCCKFILSS